MVAQIPLHTEWCKLDEGFGNGFLQIFHFMDQNFPK